MDGELKGVGGWLLTFIIIMAVISPAISALMVYNALYGDPMIAFAYGENWPTVQSFEWSLLAVGAVVGWLVAWRLYAVRNWRSVQLAIAGIWIASLGTNLMEIWGVAWITGIPLGMLLAASGPMVLIRPFIFGIVWTAYLLKSVRVRNTYRGVEEDVQVFE
jgi:hypothetical protein